MTFIGFPGTFTLMYTLIKRAILSLLIVLFLFFLIINIFFYFIQRAFIYFPSSEISQTPGSYQIKYFDIIINTNEGTIHGWEIPHQERKAYILYFNGNGGNIGSRVDAYKILHDLGYHIFTFDYPGYGRSCGSPSKKAIEESLFYLDHYLNANIKEGIPLLVHGFSLGGAIASIYALGYDADALVLEATFTSIEDMAKLYYPYIFSDYILTEDYDTYSIIADIDIPKLIFHSPDDDIIPFYMGELLFEKSDGIRIFKELQGAHNVMPSLNKLNYELGFKELFDTLLKY